MAKTAALKGKNRPNYGVSAAEFLRAWQDPNINSYDDLVEHFKSLGKNIPKQTIVQRGYNLRKKLQSVGAEMKSLNGHKGHSLDLNALAAIVNGTAN